jgi:opacity protein-like surface antigen
MIQRTTKIGVAAAFAAALTAAASTAVAQDIGERRPIEDNSGPGFSASPSAYFPTRGGTGFGIDATADYGVPVSPLVIAPGGRFAAYIGGDGAITGMPMAEAMLPVGALVPYVRAGVGIGHANAPNDTGAALMGGGGIKVHVSRDALVGVDATYEAITGTGFNTLSIGPRAELRY